MDPKRNYAAWVRVESSNVHSVIWYEDRRGRPWLGVRYGGQTVNGHVRPIVTYDYEGVPENVYHAIVTAASKGKAIDKLVKKGGYRFVGPT